MRVINILKETISNIVGNAFRANTIKPFKMSYQMSQPSIFGRPLSHHQLAAGDNRIRFAYSRSTSYQSNDHQLPIDVRRIFHPAPLPPSVPGEGKPT